MRINGYIAVYPLMQQSPSRRGRVSALAPAAVLVVAAVAVAAYFGYHQYRVHRLAQRVRRSFAARDYAGASEALRRWLVLSPRSGEAHYYKGWEALALNHPQDAEQAIGQAGTLGFDQTRLACLTAVYHARADRFAEAEPVLTQAFLNRIEPQDLIARELARILISTFRLDRAVWPIERWRTLAPDDPQPYLWINEIWARSEVDSALLIHNYRAALDRDPLLDSARLGLARELSKARRFEDAEPEFLAYLERHPHDSTALLSLGRNAFQQGDLEKSKRYFETVLAVAPDDPEALKELSQIDLRLGRVQQAHARLERLVAVQPFDHEIRYSYAESLRLAGDEARAKEQVLQADRLRKERNHLLELRFQLLKHPLDIEARFQIAKWLLEHGQDQEGLKWTKEILRADPGHPATHMLLAAYHAKHGNHGLANYHRLSAAQSPK